MYRCLRPRRFFLLYFIIFSIFVMLLLYNIESFCPDSSRTEANMNIMEKYEKKLKYVQEKEKQLNQLEKQLQILENNLKANVPSPIQKGKKEMSATVPVIYAITPTYARPVQKAELTRLLYTFLHVPNFHWILVEDAASETPLVTNFLKNSDIRYTHLYEPTPSEYKLQPKDPSWLKPRGVLQRNKGLEWLRENIDVGNHNAIVYFADDDNTYSLQLFEEMRYTKKVSVWPVGLVGYLWHERPIVKAGRVKGWHTFWKPERAFATDMAGFAINLQLFFDYPDAAFSNLIRRGELESDLIKKLHITMDDLEPKADDCTKVLVWHTRTEVPSLKNEEKFRALGKHGSDRSIEV